MALKMELKNKDVTFEDIVEFFYKETSHEEAKKRAYKFYEYVGRLKGMDSMSAAPTLSEFLIEEIFWMGVLYAHKNPQDIVISEAEKVPEEVIEKLPKKKKEKLSKGPSKDPATGQDGMMFG